MLVSPKKKSYAKKDQDQRLKSRTDNRNKEERRLDLKFFSKQRTTRKRKAQKKNTEILKTAAKQNITF